MDAMKYLKVASLQFAAVACRGFATTFQIAASYLEGALIDTLPTVTGADEKARILYAEENFDKKVKSWMN